MSHQFDTKPSRNDTPQLVGSWLIVGIPLAYGVFNAVKAALQLFNG